MVLGFIYVILLFFSEAVILSKDTKPLKELINGRKSNFNWMSNPV
ncbi:hypothetical protein SAMN05216362_101217 [Piscibacillus halophilus]|uniref:Uncharacterized protein n=1 Tax=Piscibacillus halophilus TaxID=571933 RepID=A0A1H8Z6I5_9BACI|nr:hypothetical protein SAMN05216362_101217 [Piscibacillus halophilus]